MSNRGIRLTTLDRMRRFVEMHLSDTAREILHVSYRPGAAFPPAVLLRVGERRFRLELAPGDCAWTLATDDLRPQLLETFAGAGRDFQDWLLVGLAKYTLQLERQRV